MIASFIYSMIGYCFILSPVYILIRFFYKRRETKNLFKEAWCFSFFLYCVCIFSQTVIPSLGVESSIRHGNLIPFKTIGFYIQQLGGQMHTIAVYNLLGNILLFIPFGFYIPSVWYTLQSNWKMLLVSFGIPFVIESIQFFIGRSVDVDDVILNMFAIFLGFILFVGYQRMFKFNSEMQ